MAYRYWFMAIVKPGETLEAIKAEPYKLNISLWILFFFSLMYSFTAIILYSVKVLPAIEPWLPIAKERYYLYQTFWTIPWGLATATIMAGAAHIIAIVGRHRSDSFNFKNAMAVTAIAWVIPSFVFMWLPETLVVPFYGGSPWPSWFEVLRLSVFAPVWQLILMVVGMRETYAVSWIRGIIIGLVAVALSFIMFLPFMR